MTFYFHKKYEKCKYHLLFDFYFSITYRHLQLQMHHKCVNDSNPNPPTSLYCIVVLQNDINYYHKFLSTLQSSNKTIN